MAINHKTNHHHHVTATRPHCMLMQRARTREAQEDAISLISSAPHQSRSLRFQQRCRQSGPPVTVTKLNALVARRGTVLHGLQLQGFTTAVYIRDKLPEAYRLRKWRKANADRVSKFPWRV